jgi:high-affinity Fe2+/Pb2+ permease
MSAVAIVFIAVGVVLLLVVALLFLYQLPELRRYLKMRGM